MNEKIKNELQLIINDLAELDVDLVHLGLAGEAELVDMQITRIRNLIDNDLS